MAVFLLIQFGFENELRKFIGIVYRLIFKDFENWKMLWRLSNDWVDVLFMDVRRKILLNFCTSGKVCSFLFYCLKNFIGFDYRLAKFFVLVFYRGKFFV